MTPENTKQDTSFNADLSDRREKGVWETRYPEKESQNAILWERNFLVIIFFSVLIASILFGITCKFFSDELSSINTIFEIKSYSYAFLGGMLGGTVFAMKWLYHSVAKWTWNIDRQLWRILTPLLSAAVALIIVILMDSEFINSDHNIKSVYKSFAFGFLAGYFSDSAIGKLTEIAQVLFGSMNSKGK